MPLSGSGFHVAQMRKENILHISFCLLISIYLVTLYTCDTEEGHDGAMGVVSPALLPHQGPDLQPPRQSSSAGHHHYFFLIPSPQTVILGSRAASAAALVLCSPVSQLCIDTLVGAARLSYRPWVLLSRARLSRARHCSGHLAALTTKVRSALPRAGSTPSLSLLSCHSSC